MSNQFSELKIYQPNKVRSSQNFWGKFLWVFEDDSDKKT